MIILGIGTDIIECERIDRMILRHGDHFIGRVFTESEILYCSGRKSSDQHFAGRWAAKEAILKALGTGWITGIAWTDIEVVNERGGRPIVQLHQGAARIAKEKGIQRIDVSISHCKAYATAFALAIAESV